MDNDRTLMTNRSGVEWDKENAAADGAVPLGIGRAARCSLGMPLGLSGVGVGGCCRAPRHPCDQRCCQLLSGRCTCRRHYCCCCCCCAWGTRCHLPSTAPRPRRCRWGWRGGGCRERGCAVDGTVEVGHIEGVGCCFRLLEPVHGWGAISLWLETPVSLIK